MVNIWFWLVFLVNTLFLLIRVASIYLFRSFKVRRLLKGGTNFKVRGIIHINFFGDFGNRKTFTKLVIGEGL